MISLVLIGYTSNYSSLIGSCVFCHKAYCMEINTCFAIIPEQCSVCNCACNYKDQYIGFYIYQYKCRSISHCNYAYLTDMHIVVRLSMFVGICGSINPLVYVICKVYIHLYIFVRQCVSVPDTMWVYMLVNVFTQANCK